MEALHYLSATEALSLFKQKKLSPVELMKAVIKRAEDTEPHINAFSTIYFEQAIEKAKRAEQKYMRGEAVGALEGIAVASKDESDVAGMKTTQCSLIYQDHISTHNGIVSQRLLDAGAIIHARTACPEFCSLFTTHSRLNGVTRNPFNLAITPGGSSGGSGASLAVGSTTLATGSDIGGSIRYPASMCGIVGFKPPYGRVPEDGLFSLDTYNHQGPMARTVADTALMQNVICGPSPLDHSTVKPKYELPTAFNTDLRGFKVAYSLHLNYMAVDDDIVRSLHEAIALFKHLGATVEEVAIPWDKSVDVAAQGHYRQIFGMVMEPLLKKYPDLMCDYNVLYTQASLKVASDPANVYHTLMKEVEMYAFFGPLMEQYDVFICPTVTTSRVPADYASLRDPALIIGGIQAEDDMAMSFCHPFNMLSRCPVITVPAGFTDNGVPSGIQIVGKTFDDATVFRAAAALEKAQHQWRAFTPSL